MRHAILVATYACIARSGLARVTVEDAARDAGVSRATVYRHFPGGRDELVRETVAHEVAHFFLDLAEVVAGAPSFADVLEEALLHAHATVADHEVLQKLLATEPDRLLPNLTVEANRLLPPIAAFLEPHLRRLRLRPGVEVTSAAEYVARMVLSHVGAPGRWDLTDRQEVAALVRLELLAGIVDDASAAGGAAASPRGGSPRGASGRPPPLAAEGHGAPAVGPGERRVLDAAVVCLSRRGVAKSSLDDIAREAGVSRATAYRLFPGGKDTVLDATVATELARFATALGERLSGAEDLEELLVAGITFASRHLAGHEALQYLLVHEPEQVLPHVSFGHLDQVLAAASALVAPHLTRFVGDELAERTGEWVTRLVLSHAQAPSPTWDLADEASTRAFVAAFVLPGLPAATGAGVGASSCQPGGRW